MKLGMSFTVSIDKVTVSVRDRAVYSGDSVGVHLWDLKLRWMAGKGRIR